MNQFNFEVPNSKAVTTCINNPSLCFSHKKHWI